MSGEITAADLDHFERTLEALALECKISDEHMFNMLAIHGACLTAAVDKERERCAKIAVETRAPPSIGRDHGRHHEAGAQHAARRIRNPNT